jgi:biopolymer transport protein ExbD
MNSLAKNSQKSKHLIAILALLFAALGFALAAGQAQQLQKGISVQMAPTRSAAPMPAADNLDAWVVTITADGSFYFGADPMTADELTDWMKSHPRNREAKLYIKADARAPFAGVEKVLEIGRTMGFETPVLLTSQGEPTQPGTMVPPKGLEVLVGPIPGGTVATVVQIVSSGQTLPMLRINGDEISWTALENTLRQHFQKGDEPVVLLKVDEQLPFGRVVQVIDTCRATGAKVILGTPAL